MGFNSATNTIDEVSVAGEQVLPGTALFSSTFGLKFGDNLKNLTVERDLFQLFDVFQQTIYTIKEQSQEGEKTRLLGQAIADFAVATRQLFNLPPPEEAQQSPPSVPTQFSEMNTDTTDTTGIDQLREQNTLLAEQVRKFQARQDVSAKFSALRVQAQQLLDRKQLIPALFNKYFSANGDPITSDDGVVALFSVGKSAEQTPEEATLVQLDHLDFALKFLAQNSGPSDAAQHEGLFSIVGAGEIPPGPPRVATQEPEPDEAAIRNLGDSFFKSGVNNAKQSLN